MFDTRSVIGLEYPILGAIPPVALHNKKAVRRIGCDARVARMCSNPTFESGEHQVWCSVDLSGICPERCTPGRACNRRGISHSNRLLEGLLQQHRTEPALELETYAAHPPDLDKSKRFVQRDRPFGTLVTDDGEDLFQTGFSGPFDQLAQ